MGRKLPGGITQLVTVEGFLPKTLQNNFMATHFPREEFLSSLQNELEALKDENSSPRKKLISFLNGEDVPNECTKNLKKLPANKPSCFKKLNFEDFVEEEMCSSESTQDATTTIEELAPEVAPHDWDTCKFCKLLASQNQSVFSEKEIIKVESLDAHFGEITSLGESGIKEESLDFF